MDDRLPRCDAVRSVKLPDYFLSHAVWRNSYDSYQPETGVRSVVNGEVQNDFHLIQHGVGDFDFAEPIIVRCLRKGWGICRISDFVPWLAKRRRVKATTN